LCSFPGGAIGTRVRDAVSTDGRWLFFLQMDEQFSNLMMIENSH
jgi:hypothetical protein